MRHLITNQKIIDGSFHELRDKLSGRLNQKGMHSFASSHEVSGIMTEEYTEMLDAIKENDIMQLRHELYDIALAAIWGIISIDSELMDW